MKDNLLIYVCDVQGQPAEWIRILPLGRVELRDSRKPFDITPADLEEIIRKFRADKIDLVVDYQHQSLGDGEALAAGWIQDLEARNDGLYSRVTWTTKALKHIQEGEFRYYSPVMKLTRPMELKHAALTNTPALKGTALSPLLAAKYGGEGETEILVMAAAVNSDKTSQEARSKKYGIKIRPDGNVSKPGKWAEVPDEQWGDPVNYAYPMPDKAHGQDALSRWGDPSNSEQYPKAEQAVIEKRIHSRAQALGIKTQEDKSMPIQQMKGILGLTAEAQETEVLTAVQHIVQQDTALKSAITSALGLKADAKPEEITGAITALKGGQGKLANLETEVAALKDKEATRAAEGLVEEALKEGKLIPAERDLAVSDAKRDAEGFKARMAVRPKLVPLRNNLGVRTPGGNSTDEPGPEASANERLAFKAQKLAAEKNLDLAKAQAQVLKENPELDREWQQSLRVARA